MPRYLNDFASIQESPIENSRRVRSAPSKITTRRTPKANGYMNTVKGLNRKKNSMGQTASIKQIQSITDSSIFRLNTIVLHHE